MCVYAMYVGYRRLPEQMHSKRWGPRCNRADPHTLATSHGWAGAAAAASLVCTCLQGTPVACAERCGEVQELRLERMLSLATPISVGRV